jgi:hypothetical protein
MLADITQWECDEEAALGAREATSSRRIQGVLNTTGSV